MYPTDIPSLNAQVYVEEYDYDHVREEGGNRQVFGPALSVSAGGALANFDETVGVGLSAVGRTGLDLGEGYGFGKGYNNYFASVGARASFSTIIGVAAGVEGGVRFNSRAEDHPYLAGDISLHYLVGPFVGVSVNPNNFGRDWTADSGLRENGSFWDESTIYFGVRAGIF